MNTQVRCAFVSLACLFCFLSNITAQTSLYDDSALSVSSVGNPARNSTTDIDAIVYNPGGLAMSSKEGFSFQIGDVYKSMPVMFTSYENDRITPWRSNQYNAEGHYYSFLSSYKRNNFAIGFSFGRERGLGSLNFSHGTPVHGEAMTKFLSQAESWDQFDSRMKEIFIDNRDCLEMDLFSKYKCYSIGTRLVASYKFENFSFAAGLRYIDYRCPDGPGLEDLDLQLAVCRKGTGNHWTLDDYLNSVGELYGLFGDYPSSEDLAELYGELASLSRDSFDIYSEELNTKSTPVRFLIPVLSVNYRSGFFGAAINGELGSMVNKDYSFPVKLSAGVDFTIIKKLTISVGGSYYTEHNSFVSERISLMNQHTSLKKPFNIWNCNLGVNYRTLNNLNLYCGFVSGKVPIDVYGTLPCTVHNPVYVLSAGMSVPLNNNLSATIGVQRSFNSYTLNVNTDYNVNQHTYPLCMVANYNHMVLASVGLTYNINILK